jgi:hypothetical protein
LKTTKDKAIHYRAAIPPKHLRDYQLKCFSDASLGNGTRGRTFGGYALFFDECLISWGSKLLGYVVTSTMEAEYTQASISANAILWACHLLNEIIEKKSPLLPILLIDNTAAEQFSINNTVSKRTKHIDLYLYRLRDFVEEKVLQLRHVNTNDNIADAFTKALPFPTLEKHLGGSVINSNMK